MKGKIRGEMMATDGTIGVIPGGILETGEAEGVSTGDGGGSPEGIVAD